MCFSVFFCFVVLRVLLFVASKKFFFVSLFVFSHCFGFFLFVYAFSCSVFAHWILVGTMRSRIWEFSIVGSML